MKTVFPSSAKTIEVATRPEIELLLCCARTQMDSERAEQIQTLLHQSIDWTYLIQIAARHGMMPLLYWNLNATCPKAVPQDILGQLRHHFQVSTIVNLSLTKELLKLLDLFATQEIAALPFKGPVLAASVYGNLSLRWITDLDILVHERDFLRARDLLISQGYQLRIQVPWECHLVQDGGIRNVDLHQDFVPKHLSCSVSSDYLWEHLESFTLAGTTVPNLSPEVVLLMLCLNGTKDCWRNLNRICDVAELLRTYPSMDWEQVIQQAKTLGCKRLIFLGLILAKHLLGATVPEAVWQQVDSDLGARTLAVQVSEQLFSETSEPVGEVERSLFHISTRERLRDRVQSFIGLMRHSGWMTPTDKDLNYLPLPKSFSLLYYLIRPIRVFGKYRLTFLKYLGMEKSGVTH
ncbi:MAG: nucleotidyltransferase family protein [Coleofasciculus sp. S288]|nr:nucleotidyltransferase family protein [Coleofasciculus sp. S288]